MESSFSEAETRHVRVKVKARFSPDHSDLERGIWFYLYTITIENTGSDTVQLLNRHWEITDGNGHVEHVRGPGVVGKQPVLKTGESFEYTSGCPLKTPFGFMSGEFEMILLQSEETFLAEVAGFALRQSPQSLN
ncbi:MAG: Co2+/Mg2+ efflux protein ApaG [Polyangiaceae bacterium]|nr:Co2+/Mg2+ efflux protein ApaG [Polyangiaceae bacterium]